MPELTKRIEKFLNQELNLKFGTELTYDTNLRDGHIDSFSLLTLINLIEDIAKEKKMSVVIGEFLAQDLISVNSIARYILFNKPQFGSRTNEVY